MRCHYLKSFVDLLFSDQRSLSGKISHHQDGYAWLSLRKKIQLPSTVLVIFISHLFFDKFTRIPLQKCLLFR